MRFEECLACKEKPGIPVLCASCLNNRSLIENLELEVDHWKVKYQYAENILDILWNILKVKRDE